MEQDTSGAPLIFFMASVAATAIFAQLTVGNYLNARAQPGAAFDRYSLFTGLSALESASIAAIFLSMSAPAKVDVYRATWIFGSFALAAWMRAVARFIDDDGRAIDRLSVLMILPGLTATADLLSAHLFGAPFFLLPGASGSASRIIQLSGDVYHHGALAGLMSALSVVVVLAAAAVLTRAVLRRRPLDGWLLLGLMVTVLAVGLQVTLVASGSAYAAPLLFAANLIEGLRINWSTTQRLWGALALVEQRQAEQLALIEHQLELLQAQERLSRLGLQTARIGHDLRNPLTAALGALEIIEDDLSGQARPSEDMVEALDIMNTSMSHIRTLVQRVTTQARTDEPFGPVEVRAVVDDALALVKPKLRGLDVRTEVDADVWVLGRATELTQLLVNVIANAAEANTGGAGWLRVTGGVRGGRVRLSVADAGVAPPRVRERMFRGRFSTKGAEGTGLGLEICQRIARGHDGRIWLDPDTPTTTVHVELPASEAGAVK